MSGARQLALRFISGKYQGGEVALSEQAELIVGRASDLDMVLVEDMVSRRHARILCSDTSLIIEDLGSTNGTFVNGEKVKRANLKEGDRVLIGTNILRVVLADSLNSGARRRPEEIAARGTTTRAMSGSIEDIPLPDLLQLFGSSKKSGVLILKADDDEGRIYLRKGIVTFASINDLGDVPPLKAVFRLLTWNRGNFELGAADAQTMPGEVSHSVQELLMEGLRQIDELNHIRPGLPDLEASLAMPDQLTPKLRDLSPLDLDVLQLSWNHRVLAEVLNKSPATDLDTAKSVLKLLKQGYLLVE